MKSVMADLEKPTERKRWYRAKEVAEYMACGVSTVWFYTKHKKGFPQPAQLGSNYSLWDINKIQDYIESQIVQQRESNESGI